MHTQDEDRNSNPRALSFVRSLRLTVLRRGRTVISGHAALLFRVPRSGLGLVVVLVLVAGCFSGCNALNANVTTTIVRKHPDGSISVSSGKDVMFGYLSYTTNGLVISNYSANASASVIRAQSERETALIKTAVEGAGTVGGQLFKTSAGLP